MLVTHPYYLSSSSSSSSGDQSDNFYPRDTHTYMRATYRTYWQPFAMLLLLCCCYCDGYAPYVPLFVPWDPAATSVLDDHGAAWNCHILIAAAARRGILDVNAAPRMRIHRKLQVRQLAVVWLLRLLVPGTWYSTCTWYGTSLSNLSTAATLCVCSSH